MKPRYYAIFSAAALGFLVAGCGGKSIENTPEAVAKAFTEAMADGDMAAAADLCDYITRARKANEDWDDIPPGQRCPVGFVNCRAAVLRGDSNKAE